MLQPGEKELLFNLYEGRNVYHGELHDHAATGGTSDGKRPLSVWREALKALRMDFAAILDHRQVRHMFLPEWEDGLFLPGTEPGTHISDLQCADNALHYNMLFDSRDTLEKLLGEFPEYRFTGGTEGHFSYPDFTRERFTQLIDAVLAHGGFFVHPHPRQVMVSDHAPDYWFRDETGIEVFYNSYQSAHTQANYALWLELLALGKRVFACAGGDLHADATDQALTTLYAAEKTSRRILPVLRSGDFVCGSAGIRMCVGEKTMGACAPFSGNRLVACVSDFHQSAVKPEHTYFAEVLTDTGAVARFPLRPETEAFFACALPPAAFIRIEVFDETENARIAIGNPIWNQST